MKQAFRAVIAAAVLSTSATAFSSAQAATYIGSRTIGTGSVNISITTDGTIGAIDDGNIVSYVIDLVNLDGTFTLNEANSGTLITGGLSATATDLLFDFGFSGFALFQAPGPGSGDTFYCLQGITPCYTPVDVPGEAVEATTDYIYPTAPQSGVQVIASLAGTGAVPEPATWAMMILGLGAVGGAMRSARRRQKLTVSYA